MCACRCEHKHAAQAAELAPLVTAGRVQDVLLSLATAGAHLRLGRRLHVRLRRVVSRLPILLCIGRVLVGLPIGPWSWGIARHGCIAWLRLLLRVELLRCLLVLAWVVARLGHACRGCVARLLLVGHLLLWLLLGCRVVLLLRQTRHLHTTSSSSRPQDTMLSRLCLHVLLDGHTCT